MLNKIAAVGIWCSFLSLYIASYVLVGWRGIIPCLGVTIIWAAIAMIIKADRDKQVDSLDRHKAEVHNLRIMIEEYQHRIQLANTMMQKYGLSVEMPAMLPTMLPSVFDKR